MELLTREDVRRMSDNGTRGPVVVNKDQKLTPGPGTGWPPTRSRRCFLRGGRMPAHPPLVNTVPSSAPL